MLFRDESNPLDEVFPKLVDAVKSGRLPLEWIEDAIRRTLTVKQKECFCPAFINACNLQSASKYAREIREFVNLYSKTRGCNRYTTKPAQAQGSRLPAMRHRSLNNFHKKWDNNLS